MLPLQKYVSLSVTVSANWRIPILLYLIYHFACTSFGFKNDEIKQIRRCFPLQEMTSQYILDIQSNGNSFISQGADITFFPSL